ncbi:transposase [Anaerobiospirillum sp. NML120449]|uniref:transposase n=1 Tax=Anaerobiospirillum sp. NML120449 TaxID=2932817 RepID=UPI001FF2384B|nr:transposase [Anaerobiospirillum sp. NML120449]MCK0525602.1 transposase [Anaerobiospirillum sp. NML120449]
MAATSKTDKSSSFNPRPAATTRDQQDVLEKLGFADTTPEVIVEESIKPGKLKEFSKKIKKTVATVFSKQNVLSKFDKTDFFLPGKRSDSLNGEHLYLIVIIMLICSDQGSRFNMEDFKSFLWTKSCMNGLHPIAASTFSYLFPECTTTRQFYLFSRCFYSAAEYSVTPLFSPLPLEELFYSEEEFKELAAKALKNEGCMAELLEFKSLLTKSFGEQLSNSFYEGFKDILDKYSGRDSDITIASLAEVFSAYFKSDSPLDLNRVKLFKVMRELFFDLMDAVYSLLREIPSSETPVARALNSFGKSDALACDGTSTNLTVNGLTPISRGTLVPGLKTFAAYSLLYDVPVFLDIYPGVVSERRALNEVREEFAEKNMLVVADAGMFGDNLCSFDGSKGQHYLVRFPVSFNPDVVKVYSVRADYNPRRRMYKTAMVQHVSDKHCCLKDMDRDIKPGHIYLCELAPEVYGPGVHAVVIPGHENHEDNTVFVTNLPLDTDNIIKLSEQVLHLIVIYHYRWREERYFCQVKSNTIFEHCERLCPFFCGSFMFAAVIRNLIQRCFVIANTFSNSADRCLKKQKRSKVAVSDAWPSPEKGSKSCQVSEFVNEFIARVSGIQLHGSLSEKATAQVITTRCKRTRPSQQNIATSLHKSRMTITVERLFSSTIIDNKELLECDLNEVLSMAVQQVDADRSARMASTDGWLYQYTLQKNTALVRIMKRHVAYIRHARTHGYVLPFDEKDVRQRLFDSFISENIPEAGYECVAELAKSLIIDIESKNELPSIFDD